jgi:hypothetical protein
MNLMQRELEDLTATYVAGQLSKDQKRRIKQRIDHLRNELRKCHTQQSPPSYSQPNAQ